jgi:response regulator RpfG family c-di-GMP phosphodiesterase
MTNKFIINVLYVDDEENNLKPFIATFRRDFNVFTALSAKEAEVILNNVKDIHVIITDQKMPDTLGTELLVDVVKKYPKQTRIILTAFPEDKDVQDAEMTQLIYCAISKPWDVDKLKRLIIDGYDMFCSKMDLNLSISKHDKAKKDLDKTINEEPDSTE